MRCHRTPVLVLSLLALAPEAGAQTPSAQQLGVFAYPTKGQSAARQQSDEGECYLWAHQQTGIDPTAPAPATPEPKKQGADGSGLKGAAKGAAVGTAIGAIAGGTGEGAAIGAVAGTIRGRRQGKQKHKQEQEQAKQQAQAAKVQSSETFNKAFGACLEGKGYSVK